MFIFKPWTPFVGYGQTCNYVETMVTDHAIVDDILFFKQQRWSGSCMDDVDVNFITNWLTNETAHLLSRLGMSVTTQGGSGRQCVTGAGRNLSNYRFVLLNVYRFLET